MVAVLDCKGRDTNDLDMGLFLSVPGLNTLRHRLGHRIIEIPSVHSPLPRQVPNRTK